MVHDAGVACYSTFGVRSARKTLCCKFRRCCNFVMGPTISRQITAAAAPFLCVDYPLREMVDTSASLVTVASLANEPSQEQ